MRGRPVRFPPAALRASYAELGTALAVARRHGCAPATVYAAIGGKTERARAPRSTASRFASLPIGDRTARMPAVNNAALTEHRTLYPSTVVEPVGRRAIKGGHNSAKIGGMVRKGRWRGFPIYTLTLEERATCPTACRHWRSCYGNKMHLAERMAHGAALEWRLEREVAVLELAHPGGFALRLHSLGDFYSLAYVELWRRLLERHAALHVWGYTARVDVEGDRVARAIALVVRDFGWRRFAVRFSDAMMARCCTVSIEHPIQAPAGAIVCPEQTGRTESCSTCALCWQTTRPIAFIQH